MDSFYSKKDLVGKTGRRNLKAESDMNTRGDHDSNLYDENEDRAGEKLDPATGKPFDNSTETGLEALSEKTDNELEKESDDLKRQAHAESLEAVGGNEEARRWLEENMRNLDNDEEEEEDNK